MKKIKTKITFILVLALMMSLVSAVPSMAAGKKAAKKPKLPKSVKVEYFDKASNSWKPYESYSFSYNKKGDPVKIEWTSAVSPLKGSTDFSYKYRKNGKRKSASYRKSGALFVSMNGAYSNYIKKGKYYYNNKGILTKDKGVYYNAKEDGTVFGGSSRYSEGYIYKGAGVYMVKDDINYNYHKVTTGSPGILRKIQHYSSARDKWETVYTFNKEGLLKTYGRYRFRYTYDKKSGLVKSVMQTSKDKKYRYRYTVTYTSKAISKSRYNTVFNNILNPQDGDYWFFWY